MSAATATRQFVYVYPTFCVLSTSCPHQSPFGTTHTRLLPPPAMDNTPSFLLSPLNVLDEKGVLQNMSPGGERTDEHTNTHTCGNKCAIITTNTAHRQKGRYPRATRLLAGSGGSSDVKAADTGAWHLPSTLAPTSVEGWYSKLGGPAIVTHRPTTVFSPIFLFLENGDD